MADRRTTKRATRAGRTSRGVVPVLADLCHEVGTMAHRRGLIGVSVRAFDIADALDEVHDRAERARDLVTRGGK